MNYILQKASFKEPEFAFDVATGDYVPLFMLNKGIVYIDNKICEFGWFSTNPECKLVYNDNLCPVYKKSCIKASVIYSTINNYYILNDNLSIDDLKLLFEYKDHYYPYLLDRDYQERFAEEYVSFCVKHTVNTKKYDLSKYMKYTFGIEFETSLGAIPEKECFEAGLVPLKDGSITGNEYATVVLDKNDFDLVQRQMELLKKFTKKNRSCALHIHFGGYPLEVDKVFNLYKTLYFTQDELLTLLPRYAFNTEKYKDNRKSYCGKLPLFTSFEDFYNYFSCGRTFESFYNPHHNDPDHHSKWNIPTRYHNWNFINLLFYDNPKTLEARFLRPTYRFEKIYVWLAIINALMELSESKTVLDTKDYNIRNIIRNVYPEDFAAKIILGYNLLKIESLNQQKNGDFSGDDLSFEDIWDNFKI